MLKWITGAFFGSVLASAAQAATIETAGPLQTDPGVGCSFLLSGEIRPGDATALAGILDAAIRGIDNYPSHLTEQQIVLCLDSPGGSFAEAVTMATAIRERDVTTRVSPGTECLSACAIAFLGGTLNTRSGMGKQGSRYLHPTSRLGFHAPALVLPEGDFTRDDVQRAYDVAIEAVGLISQQAKALRMPQQLLTEMVTHRGEDFFFVSTLDDASNYFIQLYGFAVPRLTQEATRNACLNAWHWYLGVNTLGDTVANFQGFTSSFRSVGNGVVSFMPFDGDMYCEHKQMELGGGTADSVILSEWQTLQNARVRGRYPIWGRYPGPTRLVDLPRGNARDF